MLFLFLLILSCKKTDNYLISFYGDSHITRYDTQKWFPLFSTYNYGISGNKIAETYVNSKQPTDCLVFQIGTNDIIYQF